MLAMLATLEMLEMLAIDGDGDGERGKDEDAIERLELIIELEP